MYVIFIQAKFIYCSKDKRRKTMLTLINESNRVNATWVVIPSVSVLMSDISTHLHVINTWMKFKRLILLLSLSYNETKSEIHMFIIIKLHNIWSFDWILTIYCFCCEELHNVNNILSCCTSAHFFLTYKHILKLILCFCLWHELSSLFGVFLEIKLLSGVNSYN